MSDASSILFQSIRIALIGSCLATLSMAGFQKTYGDERPLKTKGWVELIGPQGLAPWRENTGDWFVCQDVNLAKQDPHLLSTQPGEGTLVNGATGKTVNLLSQLEHGDVEAHIEFLVSQDSNSGVYFQGRYEIQVLDSWGVENPQSSDCGGIYQRWKDGHKFEGHPPRVNASKAPGHWQEFDVVFRGPRFDEDGNKTENARFLKVIHNGKMVHEDVEVTGPTRAATFNDEQPTGPLMLQGDHGPVAYRNIRVKLLSD